MVTPEVAARCRANGIVPLLRDAEGRPLKWNFVHVDDLVDAIVIAANVRISAKCSDFASAFGAFRPSSNIRRAVDL
jgi:hypothetical protein